MRDASVVSLPTYSVASGAKGRPHTGGERQSSSEAGQLLFIIFEIEPSFSEIKQRHFDATATAPTALIPQRVRVSQGCLFLSGRLKNLKNPFFLSQKARKKLKN